MITQFAHKREQNPINYIIRQQMFKRYIKALQKSHRIYQIFKYCLSTALVISENTEPDRQIRLQL